VPEPRRVFVVVWFDLFSEPNLSSKGTGSVAFFATREDARRDAAASAEGGNRPFVVCELKPLEAFSVRHEVVSEEVETF